jgi:carboxyl-terminal processing protease
MIRRRFLIGALLAVLFAAGWWVGRGHASGDLYSNLDTFVEVLHAVQTSYVDPVEPKPLIEGGMRGMLHELDPHSEYLDAKEYENLRSSLDEQFEGIGVLVDMHEGYPVIVSPIEGSPAWEAGLLPGDLITKVEGHSVLGLSLPEIGSRIRGAAGSSVHISVARPGESDERDLVVERRHLSTPSVPYAFVMPNHVGYLRLASYGSRAGAEVAAALDTLTAAGARSLVLDLRGNPGGLVEQAVAVVQQLVPEGSTVVYTQGRVASAAHKWTAAKTPHAQLAWPIAVLVDHGSASASEITAGALQDLDRALVVGETTFGKGTVQDVYPLRNHEGALKLTTALYYTASGRSLQRPRPAEAADDDGSDDEESATDTTVTTPAPAPAKVFHTSSGRVVHGGGGVEPDLVVHPDSLPPLPKLLEDRKIAFRYAGTSEGAGGAWAPFPAFARKQGVTATDAEFEQARPSIERELAREAARRSSGAAAAARLALADDAVFRRAADVVAHARTRRDVFALGGQDPATPVRHVR